ncbi:hypothetical protein OSB04_010640 [Centaurea solstitialis]|uniref:Endonuclease/exonuclease/phosphatase domain-containing protein n=1 Tax=Centaurea solstitialis TaxID=347529 RepID=A0AA38WPI7_9ASTR|nr:hypothetical protein OSB04_010640 [Centaurea solstitialis]
MKIISLNIRGLGSCCKRTWLKEICKIQSPYMLGIQETKLKEVHNIMVLDFWGTLDGDFAHIEASGKSGGLLTVWNKNTFKCEFVIKEDNFLAVVGKWDNTSGLITFYGPNDAKGRKILWSKLDLLCEKEEISWIFLGDSNEVYGKHERFNSETNPKGSRDFNDFIQRNGLLDVRMGGNKFTRVSDNGMKFSKLDRFLMTSGFEKLWRKIGEKVLERKWSDHAPIALYDLGEISVHQLLSSLTPDCIFKDKLKNVKLAIKAWMKERDGDIESALKSAKEEVNR